jgi:hypothetical protein
MNPLDTSGILAREMIRDRVALAQHSRLVALARCCHPSTWRRAAARVVEATRSLRRPTPPVSVCCA